MDAWQIGLGWIAVASALVFVLAVADKRAAIRRRSRIPERTLLGIALLGGSPGLILAMLLVRHKTRKASFLGTLAAILVIQAGLIWLVLSK